MKSAVKLLKSKVFSKAITKKDFLMLPKGEKIAEILEKLHLLR